MAKVYQQACDAGDCLVPYSSLTVSLASNIQGHRHWVSDMADGALIATLIGWATAQNISSDNKGLKLDASWHGGRPSLRMSYRF